MAIKRILGVLSLILLAVASNATDARGAGPRAAAAEDPMVTDTRKLIDTFIQLWKENRLEELVAGYFTEDPLMLPPNHEPVRGRQAILGYFKGLRDAVRESSCSCGSRTAR
jgi:hypothetical protein